METKDMSAKLMDHYTHEAKLLECRGEYMAVVHVFFLEQKLK